MQKHLTNTQPWFIQKFPRIIATVALTVVAIIIYNAKFFTQKIQFILPTHIPKTIPSEAIGSIHLEANMLYIPSLGITAPLVYADKADEKEFQSKLAEGVVHYPGTAAVGKPGNSYFFGHSSDLPWSKGKFKTVFANLPDIETGSKIYITNPTGVQYVYIVKNTVIVKPNDTSVLDQERTASMLSLQTSYPVGTAQKRFVVQAELVQ